MPLRKSRVTYSDTPPAANSFSAPLWLPLLTDSACLAKSEKALSALASLKDFCISCKEEAFQNRARNIFARLRAPIFARDFVTMKYQLAIDSTNNKANTP